MAPFNREPGSHKLPYGLALGIALQLPFSLDGAFGGSQPMNVDGSAPGGLFYGVTAVDTATAIHTIMLSIRTSDNKVYPDTFGDLPPLLNGIQFALKDTFGTIFPNGPVIHDNADLHLLAPEYVQFDLGSGPQPGSAVTARLSTIPPEDALSLPRGWAIGLLIRDDLLALADMEAWAYGRNLEPLA